MNEIRFNNGRKERGYKDRLFVGRGEQVYEFTGASIPGVCAVVGSDYEKNGKWSNTTYRIALASDAWSLVSSQSWEGGERFHGCASVDEIVTQFKEAGCTAPPAAIVACLEQSIQATMARVRKIEADLAALG